MNTHQKPSICGLILAVMMLLALAGCVTETPPVEVEAQDGTTPTAPAPTETAPAAAPYPPPVAVSQPEAAQPTAMQPYPPPEGALPTPTAMKPPLCQFGGGPTPEPNGPMLDEFVFSEPRVVLTSTTALSIVEWLPDNQRLLITRDVPEKGGHQTIETVNTHTGETEVYAEQYGNGSGWPFWLPEQQAVIYTTWIMNNETPQKGDHVELWFSLGHMSEAEQISPDVSGVSLSSDGKYVLYFSPPTGDVPFVWNPSTRTAQAMELDLQGRAYTRFSHNQSFIPKPGRTFRMAPQPGGKWITFYSRSLLFLANVQSGEVCEVDLGSGRDEPHWGVNPQWSPDGRYLAMTAVRGYPDTAGTYGDVMVLDMFTGELSLPDLPNYAFEIAWHSNSQTLAVLLKDGMPGRSQMGLYLIDVERNAVQRVLPDHIFGGSSAGRLSWSPDGRIIAIDCTKWPETRTEIAEGRVCVIDVTVQP